MTIEGFAAPRGEAPWLTRSNLVTGLFLLPLILLLGGWFVVPLLRLFELSLSAPEGPFAAYRELLGGSVYRDVFVNTVLLAVTVTLSCVLLAYPTAYLLTRLRGLWFTIALYCVLFPFWISVLVRTFSWMLLLERNGPINRLLLAGGVVDRPLALIFNDIGVHIGMVHVLLPYALLPIYAAMLRVDERLLLASDGLGASPFATFRRVYLPLTMPGVAAGGAFVFLLALGFFITPALLGGLQNLTVAMLIDRFVNEYLNWPVAAAASFCLLVIILALLAVLARFLSFGQVLVKR